MEQATARRALMSLESTLLPVRILAGVPLGVFGVFVLLSLFGEGSVVVGLLMILAAVGGPAVHAAVVLGLRRDRGWTAKAAVRGSLGLIVLDGAALATFVQAGLRQGELLVPLGVLGLLAVHSLCAGLGHELGRSRRQARPGALPALVEP